MTNIIGMTRTPFFKDPASIQRFHSLVRFCDRAELVREVFPMAGHLAPRKLRDMIEGSKQLSGIHKTRPRGKLSSGTSPKFLQSVQERYEASLLIKLALQSGIDVHKDLLLKPAHLEAKGVLLDRLLEVYARYLMLTQHLPETATLTFESFYVLLQRYKDGEVVLRHCQECGCDHVYSVLHTFNPRSLCPVCHMVAQKQEPRYMSTDRRTTTAWRTQQAGFGVMQMLIGVFMVGLLMLLVSGEVKGHAVSSTIQASCSLKEVSWLSPHHWPNWPCQS